MVQYLSIILGLFHNKSHYKVDKLFTDRMTGKGAGESLSKHVHMNCQCRPPPCLVCLGLAESGAEDTQCNIRRERRSEEIMTTHKNKTHK